MGCRPERSTTWVKALGAAAGISKSEVSRICAELDHDLEAFRARRYSKRPVGQPYSWQLLLGHRLDDQPCWDAQAAGGFRR